MGVMKFVVIAVGLALCASGAHASEELSAEDAAFVKRFKKANKAVESVPAFEGYVSQKLYDDRHMGESLVVCREKYSNNETGGLAWRLTARMRSLNEMYRLTGDAKYLRANLDCLRAALAKRDDKTGAELWTGEVAPAWGCGKYAKRGRAVFAVHTGLIVYVGMDCLGLIKTGAPKLRTELGDEFDVLAQGMTEAIAWHDRQWRAGPGADEGHYVGLNQEEVCEDKPLPGNRMSAMGLALWRSWEVTGNSVHCDRARAMGRYIKHRLTPAPDGAYYWPYWLPIEAVQGPAGKDTINGEDVSHGSLTALFPILLANAGEVFDEADKTRLANTFLLGVGRLGDGIIFADVTGDPSKEPRYAGACARWLPLVPYDARVFEPVAQFFVRYIPTPGPLETALLLRFGPEAKGVGE